MEPTGNKIIQRPELIEKLVFTCPAGKSDPTFYYSIEVMNA
jgi:hypothetical protein